ncbi:two-component system, cell cycle response regulator [Cohaesibacter sp. ES.047]|uniref:PleD family two-component system response regulator n=1 Tax=Cohaesibacter sp. ES.047 TaxID=1798205 RepID=UPI000BB98429|nr:PleD family two-component system response regulator [Cohaesibacter sp. ES.047]SNY93912.1 two-component system, cell cycle response regulator [Cohaesibacter sp. ES.047]
MSARILVVDDIPANVKLLEARLMAEYFDVLCAHSGEESLEILDNNMVDIVLLDVMMPGMDGFEVCRRIKANPQTMHIPVVMVTALDQVSDRVDGLRAGADDFLTKPVNDMALISRVKSLVRIKMMTDELRSRASTTEQMGLEDGSFLEQIQHREGGRILLVDDMRSSAERIGKQVRGTFELFVESDSQAVLRRCADEDFDCALINLNMNTFDPLRLCAQMRSLESSRMLPILALADESEQARIMRALDLGVNDYIRQPVDRNELTARIQTQVLRKRYTDALRNSIQHTMEMAITDGLTKLYNRRYMTTHLNSLLASAKENDKPLSLLLMDIDFFKSVNDTHGHDAGDEVLQEFSHRLRKNTRGIDLVCRYGGEEFVVIMPDTDHSLATVVAERIRKKVAEKPFIIHKGRNMIDVTVSIGLAASMNGTESPDRLLKRADEALYRAKKDGRNRVVTATEHAA